MGFQKKLRMFGHHPDLQGDYERHFQQHSKKEGGYHTALMGKQVVIESLRNDLPPDVCLIPRDQHLEVLDEEFGDPICHTAFVGAFPMVGYFSIPFSSWGLYVDYERKGSLFAMLNCEEDVQRMEGINQLGYLLSPRPNNYPTDGKVQHAPHEFIHNRFLHCRMTSALMEVVLARGGFTPEERAPIVIAMDTHDIAMPTGGDSVIRIDRENLCEEKNYTEVMTRRNLHLRLAIFGYCVERAQRQILGKGMPGKLVSAIDRIGYVAADCYYVGAARPSRIRGLLLKHPLIMDVWQDIRFTEDKETFYFSDVDRLYLFQKLRAYEHVEFLLNPYCRALDHTLYSKVKKYYDLGIITKNDLLSHTDEWLERRLDELGEMKRDMSPDDLDWKKFETEQEMEQFCQKLEKMISHKEHIKQFDVGLSWLVMKDEKIMPLGEALDTDRRNELLDLSKSRQGWYVYWYK